MATRRVRLDFKCDDGKKLLQYTHDIPATLVGRDAASSQSDPSYMSLFVQTIQPIIQAHEAACRAASSPSCENCGKPTVKTLMTPMSWLHLPDPFLNIWVNPGCESGSCETKLRQAMQTTMQMVAETADSEGIQGTEAMELVPCKVCRRTDSTKKCARCKVVAYCGREHQRADWASHKLVCAPKE